MGFQCFGPHEVVLLGQVHQVDSSAPVQVESVTVAPCDPFRNGRHGADTAFEDTVAKIPEAAAGSSDRNRRLTGCFDPLEHDNPGRKELASA